jgi:hypothetical protein
MNLGERYYQLSLLGRVSFLEAVAPAALVVRPHATEADSAPSAAGTQIGPSRVAKGSGQRRNPLYRGPGVALSAAAPWMRGKPQLHILPLSKAPGTPFVDLITLGRTSGNDIQLADPSVSRFQAFFRRRVGEWYLCDAGSKNGTRVAGSLLAPRTEAKLQSRAKVQFGSIETTFYGSDALFDLLTQGD